MDQNFFGGVQFIPGVGHIEVGSPGAALGDDASVMMISGFGAAGADQRQIAIDPATGKQVSVEGPMMVGLLQRRVTVFGIELPVWAWVLIGLGVLGAGWVFFKSRK